MRGYLLVSNVDHAEVSLPRLRTIHGDSLIGEAGRAEEAALLVTLSSARALKLPSLREIRRGGVTITNNQGLCYVDTIQWDKLGVDTTVTIKNNNNEERSYFCNHLSNSNSFF